MQGIEQLSLLNAMLENVVSGDLSCRIDDSLLEPEYERLYQNICIILNREQEYEFEMQAATSQILSVSEDLTSTLEENDEHSQNLFNTARDINELNNGNYRETTEAIQKMKDIVTHLDEIRTSSDTAKNASLRADEAIKTGLDQVYNLIKLIDAINVTTRQTVKYVQRFSNLTDKITGILKNVDNLARETQILSFNASIESKRAGAEGRGFGVIAGAIRDLAEESKREVKNIEEVIENISTDLKALTENIYDDYENVNKSVDNTKTIEVSLGNIRETFASVNSLIVQITRMADLEGVLAATVSQDISQIESNSEKVNSGFQHVYDAIRMQKDSFTNLNNLGRFLTNASVDIARLNETAGSEKTAGAQADEKIEKQAESAFLILERQAISNIRFRLMAPATHQVILDRILNNNIIEAVWTNDKRGKFIYSNPPAGIANAKVRDWFKESIQGKRYISGTYISAITKKPCITVSLPFKDEAGNIIGVIGADLRIQL